MTRYITPELVIKINAQHGGPGAGVSDRGGVEGAVMRCQQSVFGDDAFPTIWLKAGALLHGLCSTQYFSDGNKRTAWLAAEYFLQINGVRLGDIPDVQADAFVRAIGIDGTLGVETAAEWFEVTAAQRRPGHTQDPRFEYMVLCEGVLLDSPAPGIVTLIGAHTSGVHAKQLPAPHQLVLATRMHRSLRDLGKTPTLSVRVEQERRVIRQRPGSNWSLELASPAVGGHPHQPDGVMPTILSLPLDMSVIQPGTVEFVVSLDEEEVGRVRFDVQLVPEMDVEEWFRKLGH
ncbi:MAG: doc [Frankiales bacterium]|nr:doc [Frankiales bacterium]